MLDRIHYVPTESMSRGFNRYQAVRRIRMAIDISDLNRWQTNRLEGPLSAIPGFLFAFKLKLHLEVTLFPKQRTPATIEVGGRTLDVILFEINA